MSLGKLNYDALNENFCYWYYIVNGSFPSSAKHYKTSTLVKKIWELKRKAKGI